MIGSMVSKWDIYGYSYLCPGVSETQSLGCPGQEVIGSMVSKWDIYGYSYLCPGVSETQSLGCPGQEVIESMVSKWDIYGYSYLCPGVSETQNPYHSHKNPLKYQYENGMGPSSWEGSPTIEGPSRNP